MFVGLYDLQDSSWGQDLAYLLVYFGKESQDRLYMMDHTLNLGFYNHCFLNLHCPHWAFFTVYFLLSVSPMAACLPHALESLLLGELLVACIICSSTEPPMSDSQLCQSTESPMLGSQLCQCYLVSGPRAEFRNLQFSGNNPCDANLQPGMESLMT